jgi:hypothetical protein
MAMMRSALQILVIAAAAGAAVAPVDPRTVERWYSTGLYPPIQRVLTPVSNLVPFAWFDLLTIGAAAAAIAVVCRSALRARRKRTWRPLLSAVGRLLTAAACLYLIFLTLWGMNYRRLPMLDRLVLARTDASSGDVIALGLTAVEQMNALHARAHAEGWRTAPWREHRLRDAYASVQGLLSDAAPAAPGRLKWSIYGPYFRWATVDGMINPFGLEAIANPDLLPFEQPFVAAHEWAHLAGYANEAEASFVGWLTCVRSSAPAAYSGWLFAYWQISSEVGPDHRQRLAKALGEGPRRDIQAITDRLRRGQLPLLRDASWRMYDHYLKANRVEEGIRSYGLVVTLLVRAKFENGWTPVLAGS